MSEDKQAQIPSIPFDEGLLSPATGGTPLSETVPEGLKAPKDNNRDEGIILNG